MRADDFFNEVEVPIAANDPWANYPWLMGASSSSATWFVHHFDHDMVAKLRQAPSADWAETEVAVALCQLVHEELVAFGTSGGERLTDDELATAIRALVAVTRRVGVDFDPPYRNYSTFKSYWLRNDGYGSYQARRELLGELFDPLYMRLLRLEESTFEALIDPISPRAEVGWPAVDEEIRELAAASRAPPHLRTTRT